MSRLDEKTHWPLHDGKHWRTRCKMPKCIFFSNWFCEKCQKHFCLTSKRNCFYHHPCTDENHKNDHRKCDQSGSSQTTTSQRCKKKIKSTSVAGNKNLERRSSVQTVSTVKIGCSRQSKKIQKQALQTVVASKQLVRKSKAVNVSADKKLDSSGPNKVMFMAALDLCSM